MSHYALDGASPLPAIALAPRPGHRVLDLCAAPGGKTLVLAGQLFGAAASSPRTLLISNDRSQPRRTRLRRVIEEFVPKRFLREQSELSENPDAPAGMTAPSGCIAVTGVDAAAWGRGMAAPRWSTIGFDRILIDAPCSSERHFMHGAADAMWSRSRLKRDAELQGSILRNGVRMLAVGGRLVYSTCSLANEENDGVVSKLLNHKRHGAGLALVDALGGALAEPSIASLLKGVQRTRYGALMLPDSSRFGPLFWAVIERRAPADEAGEGGSLSDDNDGEGGGDAESEKSTSDDGNDEYYGEQEGRQSEIQDVGTHTIEAVKSIELK